LGQRVNSNRFSTTTMTTTIKAFRTIRLRAFLMAIFIFPVAFALTGYGSGTWQQSAPATQQPPPAAQQTAPAAANEAPVTSAATPNKKTRRRHSRHAAAASAKETVTSAAELQNDLQAKYKTTKLGSDDIRVAVAGKEITLTGSVKRAEHKGLATIEARRVAKQDGWTEFHVLNKLAVEK
jgi:hypothetical protein